MTLNLNLPSLLSEMAIFVVLARLGASPPGHQRDTRARPGLAGHDNDAPAHGGKTRRTNEAAGRDVLSEDVTGASNADVLTCGGKADDTEQSRLVA
ncbi:hypothetical protein B0H10DRAFT_1980829 [Mycena sp. CBHHK59/15]|nr:hypothetical protein B0H10DRAFT_1980829 [Mycena sp. CBHHK59/15]